MSKPHYKLRALSNPEIVGNGVTHEARIRASDLASQTTANTALVLTLTTVPKGYFVEKVIVDLKKPFKDKSDPAFNSTTVKIGDTGQDDRFITSQQLNENGAEIVNPVYENTAYGPYTADTDLIATIGSMAAKKLSDLDVGELSVQVKLIDPNSVAKN